MPTRRPKIGKYVQELPISNIPELAKRTFPFGPKEFCCGYGQVCFFGLMPAYSLVVWDSDGNGICRLFIFPFSLSQAPVMWSRLPETTFPRGNFMERLYMKTYCL